MYRRLVGICVATLVLVGMAALPAAAVSSSTQKKFITAIHRSAPATKSVSTKKLLALAGSLCAGLRFAPVADEVGILRESSNSYHLPKNQVVPIVATSVAYICPSHNAAVVSYEKHPTSTPPTKTAAPPTTGHTTPTKGRSHGPPLTQQQESARQAALQYLQTQPFSQQGLIDQLDSSAGDGYSVADATAAVGSLTNVNWNNEAVQAAKQYMQQQPFSCADLIQQLDSSAGEGYTVAQATFGATQAGDCGSGAPTSTSGSTGVTGSTP
jgi:hypothetical protein